MKLSEREQRQQQQQHKEQVIKMCACNFSPSLNKSVEFMNNRDMFLSRAPRAMANVFFFLTLTFSRCAAFYETSAVHSKFNDNKFPPLRD
jgi:hypothetical protein